MSVTVDVPGEPLPPLPPRTPSGDGVASDCIVDARGGVDGDDDCCGTARKSSRRLCAGDEEARAPWALESANGGVRGGDGERGGKRFPERVGDMPLIERRLLLGEPRPPSSPPEGGVMEVSRE